MAQPLRGSAQGGGVLHVRTGNVHGVSLQLLQQLHDRAGIHCRTVSG
jgi:hypothetical protein